ncbi:thiol:disulfide interchange protein [Beggiatoa alba B18LD]|uniref:Thiol:disulfide interchange protein DsbD n=2 Tax=Beggiatoa alba TaxID=1022 RepID=I3CHF7_9GAMM|nr:thiol:disulfide interchange protein [Beggiatoa alba B18LD]
MGIAFATPPNLTDMLQSGRHGNQSLEDNGLQPLANTIPPATTTTAETTAQQAPVNVEDEFLDPEKAFFLSTQVIDAQTVQVTWLVAEGYYLYENKMQFSADNAKIQKIILPSSQMKDDPLFGNVQVFEQPEVVATIIFGAVQTETIVLTVHYQGCASAGLCYPPMAKTITLTMPHTNASSVPPVSSEVSALPIENNLVQPAVVPATTPAPVLISEQDAIAQALMQDNIFYTLLLFFGFGLLLAFTPCVFPMIPILSSIIVGQGKQLSTYSAFSLSLVYVLSMALTYTVAGVFAGLVGENLQASFQEPIVIIVFSLIFLALALSMFGFYNLQMPNVLQSKLTDVSNQQKGGTWIGVAIMGFLSALIVGPCVAAPLAGILIYISQTKDAVFGGMALFSLSLGMGVPLLLIGTSAGRFLPKAGLWMETVKQVFGVLLLAVAWWLLARLLPDFVVLMGWATLFIVSAVYMGVLEPLQVGVSHWRRLWKGVGAVLFIYGILLIITASQGGKAVLYPLQLLGNAANGETVKTELTFQKVKGLEGLNQAIARAKQAGKAVMLDFYADWCVACKEMEVFTFTNQQVQQQLQSFVLLQVDVTANDEQDKALYKHFGIFGPPAIMFYNTQGIEQIAYRVVGFTSADKFSQHIATFQQSL